MPKKGEKGKKLSEDTKRKMSESHKGKVKTPEHRANLSKSKKGKPVAPKSVETRAKLSKALKGRKQSPEHIAKVAKALTGKKASAATKLKLSESHKGVNKGHTVSEETRLKISQAALKRALAGRHAGFKTHKPHPYTTRGGRCIILRNSWEYKAAVYIDNKGWIWEYEQAPIFHNNRGYLPDFFIWDNEGDLIKIIEIKGDFKEPARKKFYMFKEYLESCGVEVELWNEERLKELGIL